MFTKQLMKHHHSQICVLFKVSLFLLETLVAILQKKFCALQNFYFLLQTNETSQFATTACNCNDKTSVTI